MYSVVSLKISESVSSLPVPLIKIGVNSLRSLPNVPWVNYWTSGNRTDRFANNSALDAA